MTNPFEDMTSAQISAFLARVSEIRLRFVTVSDRMDKHFKKKLTWSPLQFGIYLHTMMSALLKISEDQYEEACWLEHVRR